MRPYLEPIDTLKEKDAPKINSDGNSGRTLNVLVHIVFFGGLITAILHMDFSKSQDRATRSKNGHDQSDADVASIYAHELPTPEISLEADTPPRARIVSEDY